MKKKDLEAYKNTKRGSKVYPTLNRLFIDGLFCFLCAIFLVVSTMITHDSNWFYIAAVILVIAGIFFMIMSYKFKEGEIVRMKKAKMKKNDKVDKK